MERYTEILTEQKVTSQRVHLLRLLLHDNQRSKLWISGICFANFLKTTFTKIMMLDMDSLTAVIRSLLSITNKVGDELYPDI